MIPNVEMTFGTDPQNKGQTLNPYSQREQQQTMHKQQHTQRLRTNYSRGYRVLVEGKA